MRHKSSGSSNSINLYFDHFDDNKFVMLDGNNPNNINNRLTVKPRNQYLPKYYSIQDNLQIVVDERKNTPLLNFVLMDIPLSYVEPSHVEYVETQKNLKEGWAKVYKEIIDKSYEKINEETFLHDLIYIFNEKKLTEISNLISNYQNYINNNSDFFYSLSNFLSKYSEIKSLKAKMCLSVINGSEISLTLHKENRCIFKESMYLSKLNLIFTSENDVKFSSSDSNDEDYFIYGVFNSPKSFLANSKIKKLLRMLDE